MGNSLSNSCHGLEALGQQSQRQANDTPKGLHSTNINPLLWEQSGSSQIHWLIWSSQRAFVPRQHLHLESICIHWLAGLPRQHPNRTKQGANWEAKWPPYSCHPCNLDEWAIQPVQRIGSWPSFFFKQMAELGWRKRAPGSGLKEMEESWLFQSFPC